MVITGQLTTQAPVKRETQRPLTANKPPAPQQPLTTGKAPPNMAVRQKAAARVMG